MFYVGICLLEELLVFYSVVGFQVDDIDWYIVEFYEFVFGFGVFVICFFYLCYVIDFNWLVDGQSLYLGQNIIGLCLLMIFDNLLLYCEGCELDVVEIVYCLQVYWYFYYVVLQVELECLKVVYGYVLLWDVYLICLVILYLFEGELLVFNFGIVSGVVCVFGFGEDLLVLVQ